VPALVWVHAAAGSLLPCWCLSYHRGVSRMSVAGVRWCWSFYRDRRVLHHGVKAPAPPRNDGSRSQVFKVPGTFALT
jgi:hypothetical protein